MIYVMSDLHGECDKYITMLKKFDFNDNDVLYVLGDVLGRGPDPVKVLQDNVYPVMGNHAWMAIDVLEILLEEITETNYATQINESTIQKLMEWQQNGGRRHDFYLFRKPCTAAVWCQA